MSDELKAILAYLLRSDQEMRVAYGMETSEVDRHLALLTPVAGVCRDV